LHSDARLQAAFWGNPDLLTIYGESAGAGSVSNHLVAPRSAGLFDRAIAESGPFSAWIAKPLAIAENDFDKVLSETGCGGQGKSPGPVSCPRKLPPAGPKGSKRIPMPMKGPLAL